MKEWQFWTLTGSGGLFLMLVLINVLLFTQNRSLQAEVSARQQFIAQSAQLEALYKDIIIALANLSVRDKDDELGQLLTAHGITVSATPKTGADEGAEKTTAKPRK